jgi:hypothetical protein
MKSLKQIVFAVYVVICSAVQSQAHEGHGHESPLSPGHYIANPEHALPIALTFITALVAGWLIYRKAVKSKSNK